MKGKQNKKWRRGDLVLHDAHPKTHAMLMEIVDLKPGHAKAVFLSTPPSGQGGKEGMAEGVWHPVEVLHDPVRFLKTEEYLETLRARAARRPRTNEETSP